MADLETFVCALGWLDVGQREQVFRAGVASLVEVSGVVIIGFFALMTLNLVSGWKAFRLSRAPRPVTAPVRAGREPTAI